MRRTRRVGCGWLLSRDSRNLLHSSPRRRAGIPVISESGGRASRLEQRRRSAACTPARTNTGPTPYSRSPCSAPPRTLGVPGGCGRRSSRGPPARRWSSSTRRHLCGRNFSSCCENAGVRAVDWGVMPYLSRTNSCEHLRQGRRVPSQCPLPMIVPAHGKRAVIVRASRWS